ncbi:MAG: long-chain fatty acid--CoA ligase [Micropepsaceae bacterium]
MNITQVLHRNLQQGADRVMTVFGDRTTTTRSFVDRVARLAGALQQLGMQPGDRVAMLALNSDRYMEYFYAVPWGNGVINPCNIRWSVTENAYALTDSESSILIVDDAFKDTALVLKSQVPSLRHILYAGDGATPPGMLRYESLITNSTPVTDARRGGDELLGIFYTGGTTGFPKGVMISHGAFWASQIAIVAEGIVPRHATMLRAAPMFHMADLGIGFVGAIQAVTHIIVPSFHPIAVMKAIQQHRVATALLVPTMIQMLINSPEVGSHDLTSLRSLVYGASPIQEKVLRDLMALLPDLRLFQAYGQTEMAPLVSILSAEHHEGTSAAAGMLRSCGRAGLCVEVQIVDADGNEVPRGTVGEIAVRGPNMMMGYWNKPEQSRSAMPGTGWLLTGDGAYMDENGFLFIVDRVKDMIVTGGENVFSAEVENVLANHPAVAMCAVIGIPHDEWGEVVHAFVVPKPDMKPTPEELIAHCKQAIANYKCPKSIEFCSSLPLSGAGKVLKTQLREPFWRDKARQVG